MAAIRIDLGIADNNAAQSRATLHIINSRLKDHADTGDQLQSRVSVLESLVAPTTNQRTAHNVARCYVQNSSSMVTHKLRDRQSGIACCGWKSAAHITMGTAVVRDDISESPYWLICERCMPQLREQMIANNDEEVDPDSMSD